MGQIFFGTKNYFGPTIFFGPNFFFGQTIFFRPNILFTLQTLSLTKPFFRNKNFFLIKFFGTQNFFWIKHFFGPWIFLDLTFFGLKICYNFLRPKKNSKKMWGKKKFCQKIFSSEKCLVCEIFWDQHFFGPTFILGPQFCWTKFFWNRELIIVS